MEVYHGFDNLPPFRHAVVTVGSFDGVHRGHRMLLQRVVDEARARGGVAVVITFDVLPRIVLGRGEGMRVLSSMEEKLALLEQAGIDAVVIAPFDEEFRMLPAARFVDRYLLDRLHTELLVVGFNHRFGHDRVAGDSIRREGLEVVRVGECDVDGDKVSSSVIRRLLDEGRTPEAERLLGHPLHPDGAETQTAG